MFAVLLKYMHHVVFSQLGLYCVSIYFLFISCPVMGFGNWDAHEAWISALLVEFSALTALIGILVPLFILVAHWQIWSDLVIKICVCVCVCIFFFRLGTCTSWWSFEEYDALKMRLNSIKSSTNFLSIFLNQCTSFSLLNLDMRYFLHGVTRISLHPLMRTWMIFF